MTNHILRVTFLLTVFFRICPGLIAQEKYEKEVTEVASKLNSELSSIASQYVSDGKKCRVAIITIENEDEKTTKLTELLSDDVTIELVLQAKGSYQILDRKNIQRLIKEKNIPNDFGNKSDFARNLGRFKTADLVIVGKVINFENNYRIIFTVIETKEGNTVSGARGMLTKTDLLKSKNEPNITTSSQNEKNTTQSELKKEGLSSSTNTKGWIEFDNRTHYKLTVYVSEDPNLIYLKATRYEQITLSPVSSDKLTSLKPGIYYVCAIQADTWGVTTCLYNKKVEVISNKGTDPIVFK